uniref:ArsR family transcriptional regulator n=1 Tax=Ignisphaera aggregans TaxID=334771 RepID=A0A7J2T9G7_9CREN
MKPVKERILELLREVCPHDLPIKEIAKRVGVSRTTASKYITILEAEEVVVCRFVGRAKLCRAKER